MLFMSCVFHAFASVHCCLVITCCERADLLALVVMFSCVFVTFPCGILGQVWYLIVSIPNLCHLSYLVYKFKKIFHTYIFFNAVYLGSFLLLKDWLEN